MPLCFDFGRIPFCSPFEVWSVALGVAVGRGDPLAAELLREGYARLRVLLLHGIPEINGEIVKN